MNDISTKDLIVQEEKCERCGTGENVEVVDYEDSMGQQTIAICQNCQLGKTPAQKMWDVVQREMGAL